MRDRQPRLFLSTKEIMEATGLSRQTINRLRKIDKLFPRAQRLGARRIGFAVQDFNHWITSRPS